MNKRLTGFVIAILVGLIAGLAYGWFVNPPPARNAALDTLRSDYQADYALMVAEKYAVDGDELSAAALLRQLSPDDPFVTVKSAIILGEQLGYSNHELLLLEALQAGISAGPNEPAEVTP